LNSRPEEDTLHGGNMESQFDKLREIAENISDSNFDVREVLLSLIDKIEKISQILDQGFSRPE